MLRARGVIGRYGVHSSIVQTGRFLPLAMVMLFAVALQACATGNRGTSRTPPTTAHDHGLDSVIPGGARTLITDYTLAVSAPSPIGLSADRDTSGATSADPPAGRVATLPAQSPGERTVSGPEDTDESLDQTNKTVPALNDLAETITRRLLLRMDETDGKPVSSAGLAGTDSGDSQGVAWNTSVTLSSRRPGEDGKVNQAINARYVDDDLVFDWKNLASETSETLTTSTDPDSPGYRNSVTPVPGSSAWKGVEYHFVVSESVVNDTHTHSYRRRNYSILVSDIEDNDDTDYLTGALSIWLPYPNDPDTTLPFFTSAVSGNDPFEVNNIASLSGEATYVGDAIGMYGSARAPSAFRYFTADVTLTTVFRPNQAWIWGTITNGRDAANDEPIFEGLALRRRYRNPDDSFFEHKTAGVIDGRYFNGRWGIQFFGNGESSADLPGSVAGTFSAQAAGDEGESLVGIFGAYQQGDVAVDTGTGNGATNGAVTAQAGDTDSLGGRATYEGDASGLYTAAGAVEAIERFSAKVRLTADFRDNYVWGVLTDGKDNTTDETVFERLQLEPVATVSDGSSLFRSQLAGTIDDEPVSGEWSGRFAARGGLSLESRAGVTGTFRIDGWDPLDGSVSWTFGTDYQGHTNGTILALNGLAEATKRVSINRMRDAMNADPLSNADAAANGGNDTRGSPWNTGVTKSSLNRVSGQGILMNQAINARFVDDDLVFDRINFSSQTSATFTTSTEPTSPGYRTAISPVLGSPNWKGVEYLHVVNEPHKRWNYSIFVSDIEDGEDTDYLAAGLSVWLPEAGDPDQTLPSFTAAAGGSDPFQVGNIESLTGRAIYVGEAFGLYESESATPAFRYFNADVRLTAEFRDNRFEAWGVVTDGRDTTTNEPIFNGLALEIAWELADDAGFFESVVTGVVNGKYFRGDWGAQLFGNGDSTTDLPGSIAGTFGAEAEDGDREVLIGVFGAYDEDLTRLPSGHELNAEKIVVDPSSSVERGDVAVSCPDGGRACIVTVAEDGTAFYDRNGGVPTLGAVYGTHWQDNPYAEDLLDHWNDSEQPGTAMELSEVGETDVAQRTSTVGALIEAAGDDPSKLGTLLRNVGVEDIEVIGERDGITYGQWKGGPAGTLNIAFDWQFAEDVDEATRARVERAGKSWSWRILDDLSAHLIEGGQEFSYRDDNDETVSLTFAEDIQVDDLLIVVVGLGESGSAWSSTRDRQATDDDYEPRWSVFGLPKDRHNQTSTLAHEIGHALGITASNGRYPSIERYTNTEDQTFTGPKTMEANGGLPVPFQWKYPDDKPGPYEPVPPGSPGARVSQSHLNVCSSIMAYCRDRTVTYGPSELDLAFLDDIGYENLDAATASEPEVYGYGAWGTYSAWGAGVHRTIRYESGDPSIDLSQGGIIVDAHDTLRGTADAFGTVPGATLADAHADMGEVTWSGSLIGVDVGNDKLPPVFGDAELSVDLSTLQGTALFDELTVHIDGASSTFRADSLEYTINVDGNSFSDSDGRLHGGFFGPSHEEMAGVLDDRTAEVNLLAGFGGKR